MKIDRFCTTYAMALILMFSQSICFCPIAWAQWDEWPFSTRAGQRSETYWKEAEEIRFDLLIHEDWLPALYRYRVHKGEVAFVGGVGVNGGTDCSVFRTRFPNMKAGEFTEVKPKLVADCGPPFFPERLLLSDNQLFILVIQRGDSALEKKSKLPSDVPANRVIEAPGLYVDSENGIKKVENFPAALFDGDVIMDGFFSPDRKEIIFSSTYSTVEPVEPHLLYKRKVSAKTREQFLKFQREKAVKMVRMDVETQTFSDVIDFPLFDDRTIWETQYSHPDRGTRTRFLGTHFFMVDDIPWISDYVLQGGKTTQRLRDHQGKQEILVDDERPIGKLDGIRIQTMAGLTKTEATMLLVTPQHPEADRFVEVNLTTSNGHSKNVAIKLLADEDTINPKVWTMQGDQFFCLAEIKSAPKGLAKRNEFRRKETDWGPMRIIQFSLDEPEKVFRHTLTSEPGWHPRRMLAHDGYLYFGNLDRLGIVRYPFTRDTRD